MIWVSGGPLGRISWKLIAADTPPSEVHQIFANELAANAGIERTTQIRALLDGSLIGALRDIHSVDSPNGHATPGWDPEAGANCLADASAPLLNGHQHPGAPETTGIRVVALALAGDSAGRADDSAVHVFRTVAATASLLQHREQGKAKIGESIVLALT